jgi:hypothetical protein
MFLYEELINLKSKNKTRVLITKKYYNHANFWL